MQSTNESQSQHGPQASRSSILGLDLLTFLMADVRDGVGPYLSVFLKGGLHWQSGEIGIAMAASSITAAICQIPAGLLVDSVRAKRLLVVISGLMVGIGCLLVVCMPKLVVVVSAQATLGAASAIIPPALAALSLGIVGRKLFPTRVSRNESFNHGGNFAAAILAGTVGQRLGYHWIFYLVCLFALAPKDRRCNEPMLDRGRCCWIPPNAETITTAIGTLLIRFVPIAAPAIPTITAPKLVSPGRWISQFPNIVVSPVSSIARTTINIPAIKPKMDQEIRLRFAKLSIRSEFVQCN
jgi:MFS family permease